MTDTDGNMNSLLIDILMFMCMYMYMHVTPYMILPCNMDIQHMYVNSYMYGHACPGFIQFRMGVGEE